MYVVFILSIISIYKKVVYKASTKRRVCTDHRVSQYDWTFSVVCGNSTFYLLHDKIWTLGDINALLKIL